VLCHACSSCDGFCWCFLLCSQVWYICCKAQAWGALGASSSMSSSNDFLSVCPHSRSRSPSPVRFTVSVVFSPFLRLFRIFCSISLHQFDVQFRYNPCSPLHPNWLTAGGPFSGLHGHGFRPPFSDKFLLLQVSCHPPKMDASFTSKFGLIELIFPLPVVLV